MLGVTDRRFFARYLTVRRWRRKRLL